MSTLYFSGHKEPSNIIGDAILIVNFILHDFKLFNVNNYLFTI